MKDYVFVWGRRCQRRWYPPHILLAKMDTKSAFRQVSVEAKTSSTFSSVFGEFVIIDR